MTRELLGIRFLEIQAEQQALAEVVVDGDPHDIESRRWKARHFNGVYPVIRQLDSSRRPAGPKGAGDDVRSVARKAGDDRSQ